MSSSQWLAHLSNGAIIAACVAAIAGFAKLLYSKSAENHSVNNAIQAEKERLLSALRTHELWWAERIVLNETDQPLIPFSHAAYSAQVKNIGVLKAGMAQHMVWFCGYIDFINAFQPMRVPLREDRKIFGI